MARYRDRLPQLDGGLFVTDGGIETTLIFRECLDLPHFAAFDLLKDEAGTAALRRYYEPYAALAGELGAGLVLESPTWRASPDWGSLIGYSPVELDELNRRGLALMAELRAEHEGSTGPIVISGCVGPQGDGYRPEVRLGAGEAEEFHARQVGIVARSEADMVCALTMTYPAEAIGVARAAAAAGLPVAVSFIVETDGRLPGGEPLGEAIAEVEEATGACPAYYMLNCAHPSHFDLPAGEPWLERIRGLRANASRLSHAELDEAEELDEGDPDELAADYLALRERLPGVTVLGGCCGTDERHVAAICRAWTAAG